MLSAATKLKHGCKFSGQERKRGFLRYTKSESVAWHAYRHLLYHVDIGGRMQAIFVGSTSLLLLTQHTD